MSKKQMGKLMFMVIGTLGLILWMLNQKVAAQDSATASFVAIIHSSLISQVQPQPQLHLEIPEAAAVGDWVTIRLIATEVQTLAGFQAQLRFDPTALSLGTAAAATEFARGRDPLTLGYVALDGSIVLGAATCPVTDCTSITYQQDPELAKGAEGAVELATFVFQVRRAGVHTLELADVLLVDTRGDVLLADSQYPLPTIESPEPTILDLSQNNRINDADAYRVISAWRELQLTSTCLAETILHYDVDGNGCLNVADVQTILAAWGAEPKPQPHPTDNEIVNATLTVNANGNQSDLLPGDGVCLTSANTCTLRAALEEANVLPGADTILFDIRNSNGSCPSLVTITGTNLVVDASDNSPVTINGYSQCGASANNQAVNGNAVIKIELRGSNAAFTYGLQILSPGNTVKGLALYNWHRQIELIGQRAYNNLIEGNFLGTNAANTHVQSASAIEGEGIRIQLGASNNLVGGTTPEARNIISGNDQDGVNLQGNGANGNIVINNYVGLKQSGTAQLRNGADGVDLAEGAANNQVGGLNPGERNVIAGNNRDGVELSHDSGTQGNQVMGNFVGLDATGATGLGNGWRGVTFEDAVMANQVYRNVIVGNGGDGVRLYTVFNNELTDNFIGVAPVGLGPGDVVPVPGMENGLTAMPNGTSGSGQGRSGIFITGGSQGTIITHNIIAFNLEYGIYINADKGYLSWGTCEAYYNRFSRNSLYDNAAQGIRLKSGTCDDGLTYYPNEGIAAPVVTNATTLQVTGTSCAGCVVEIFLADKTVVNNPAGDNFGEGKQFLGTGVADGSGNFTIPVSGISVGAIVTAHATDSSGNTSAFARNVAVTVAAATPTNTPIPPTATNTSVPPTPTNTPILPTATDTSVPPTPSDTPVPPTPTNTPIPGNDDVIYISSSADSTVGSISFADEDILSYDTSTGTWAMLFDGSDVGLGGTDIDAFTFLNDGSILLNFTNTSYSVPGVGAVEDCDIVRFIPGSLGDNTSGTFEFYFDGSQVELTASSEDIDALDVLDDGRLLVSTTASFSVTGASGNDEDLLIFTPTALGSTTSGTWALYFDGSDVELNTSSSEDVTGAWAAANGDVYLSTLGIFAVPGVSGDGADIFVCHPGSLGDTTTCTFSMYWDGSAQGSVVIDGFEVVNP